MVGINDACEILSWAYNNNIEIWLDGGWGVDALLGKETRQHNDIDLFVEEKNYNKFISQRTVPVKACSSLSSIRWRFLAYP